MSAPQLGEMSAGLAAGADVQQDAETLYEYHQLHKKIDQKADAIFCLCSLDTRVAERAAQLFLDGYGGLLIFSGGSGKLTHGRFDKPEAEVFADIARQMGVPETKLLVEPHSTNTGENVRFTYALLQEKQLSISSFVLVQKPYMERRTFATFKKQWPDPSTQILVTSPQLTWQEYPNEDNPVDLVINIAVGDLIRIREYPAKGFQIPQEIPERVWQAAQRLIQRGYSSHLP
ncbi:hypothetical protein NPX13_g3929 [Xylaria arbuscula]|uniref:DUF218 domain-containing protein n=1 Tax=Xylaria arbuscula TaxID=114810 RepID=A0A9W8TMD5_9PEZI|nr:hypothetical protein NPX13_g3929 [Xylaria arbuscula]